jgi:hypothetical protein
MFHYASILSMKCSEEKGSISICLNSVSIFSFKKSLNIIMLLYVIFQNIEHKIFQM